MTRVVLLRGLAREQGHWGRFPAILGDALGGARVLAIDLAGNGSRYRARSPASVGGLLSDCRSRLHCAGETGPFLLVGLSLGAMVATAWMSDHPQEVEGGVLINTSLRPFSPFWRRMRPSAGLRLLRTLAEPADRAERAILELTSHSPAGHPDALASWIELRQCHPVSPGNALRQLLAAARYRAPLTAPSAPVLLLSSVGDRLADPRCSREIAARWQCAHEVHPNAGHDLPLDDPGWVAERVATWLGRRRGSRRSG